MCMMQIHCSKGPSNVDFLTFKAEMFMRSGELDRAQEDISKALSEDAKIPKLILFKVKFM